MTSALARDGLSPRTVLEPCCGEGAFLRAAGAQWPDARLVGRDVSPGYIDAARDAIGRDADLEVADFFTTDWSALAARLEAPVLVLGNPPWVTNAALGALGSRHVPPKRSRPELSGFDALTGKANFDVSEWMIRRLLDVFDGRDFGLAMLVKSSVARRIVAAFGAPGSGLAGSLRWIDAPRWFGASVDAALFGIAPTSSPDGRWPVFPSLEASAPDRVLGLVDGTLTHDAAAFARTRTWAGVCDPAWRSGLKHDCARVMELTRSAAGWTSAAAGLVELEDDLVYPLLKGSDVANGRLTPKRGVLVPQRQLGAPTEWIREALPLTWAYLDANRAALAGRKSRVYDGRPAFSVFGVGEYTFAPFKVAVAGLYARPTFAFVGPHEDKPVLFDDTCYFLPFDTREEASAALEALRGPEATEFFAARLFGEDKRPVTKALLSSLDLRRLVERP